MGSQGVKEIFDLCYSIEGIAANLYEAFAKRDNDKRLKLFWKNWKKNAKEKNNNLTYWKELKKIVSRQDILPDIFDDINEVKRDLEVIKEKSKDLLDKSPTLRRRTDVFIYSLRMEYFLLHHAFMTFFYYLKPLMNNKTPIDKYDAQLAGLLKILMDFKEETSELSMFVEFLKSRLRENEKIVHTNNLDPLTGALDKRGFFATVKPLAYKAKKEKEKINIMIISLDNLTVINKKFGTKIGDSVLDSVAASIKGKIKKTDIFGRYTREKFIIYLSDQKNNKSKKDITDFENQMRKYIEKEILKTVAVTFSIGVSQKVIKSNLNKELELIIVKAEENSVSYHTK